MKRLAIIFILLLLASAAFSVSEYLLQTGLKAAMYTSMISELGWEYDGSACFYGALLGEGESVSSGRWFERGTKYNIWAYGDEDAIDLDIQITDENGRVVAEDSAYDATPNCDFRPKKSASYTITITNYESNGQVFVFWGVMNNDVSPYYNAGEKCVNALAKMMDFFSILDENAWDYRFFLNKTFLIGGIMEEGESQCFYNFSVPFDTGCHFVGFGSDEIQDFDIKLTEQWGLDQVDYDFEADDYQIICEDSDYAAVATMEGYLYDSELYALKYRVYSSRESGFVFTLILTE